jgi:8-oxo-dGTP diphosphatase
MQNPSAVRQRIATKAIIERSDGKFLLLREAATNKEGTQRGRYHLPGGRLEAGEPFLEGLSREVREETGLAVEVGGPVFVGEWFPVIHGVQNQIVGIFFACRASAEAVTLSEEHDAFVWISLSELSKYDIMEPEPDAILAWQQRR